MLKALSSYLAISTFAKQLQQLKVMWTSLWLARVDREFGQFNSFNVFISDNNTGKSMLVEDQKCSLFSEDATLHV